MCAVVRLRALMAQQSARLITNHPIVVICVIHGHAIHVLRVNSCHSFKIM
jgi:hypothetical protein